MFKDEFPHKLDNWDWQLREVDDGRPRSTQRVISRLVKASHYAQDTGRDPWEFAVTIAELRRDGVAENELRWLVCRGYIEHAEEVTTTSSERVFNHDVSLRFSKRSAFVITNAGVV